MTRYAYVCPRGFSNEYSMWSVSPEDVAEVQEIIDSMKDDTSGEAYWFEPTPAQKKRCFDWSDRQYVR